MPIFVYRVSNKYGQVYEGEIPATTEEDAFTELAVKPFMVSGVFKIDIRMKTADEMRVDRRLKLLQSYRDRMEKKENPSKPFPQPRPKRKTRRFWWVVILIIVFLLIFKLLRV